MSETYDAIVIGLGGFGSSTLYELAKRGMKVLGIDQFGIAHDQGSSHGETRIIRRAYFEHPDYVPLLDHTYRMWRELEDESGRDLMNLCGLVLSGPSDGEAVPGVVLAKEQHGIAVESLDRKDAAEQFPRIRFPEDHTILRESDAGYLRVDDCVQTHCDLAAARGATIRSHEKVVDWSATDAGVTVTTEASSYLAGKLVVACGAWSVQVLKALGISLTILRKSVFWFPKTVANSQPWPVFYIEDQGRSFYGLPGLDEASVKVAEHSGGDTVADPTNVVRDVNTTERDAVSNFITTTLSGLQTQPAAHSVCMYCMSPDGHFIVDQHPGHKNVVIAAGFSGHGFKFTPVIGSAIADLIDSGRTDLPIGFLGLR
ncbi:MAG: N-methyl-L-tryptophan oxidase [Planctomycetaceae bacterium]